MTASPHMDHHIAMHSGMQWQVPAQFNMAHWCSRRWAGSPSTAGLTAIVTHQAVGEAQHHTFAQLQSAANALSHHLLACGVQRGDRVALVLPQCFETAAIHIAVLQMGAVSMPLSQLFGPEALAFRLHDSQAVAVFVDAASVPAVLAVRGQTPHLRHVIGLGEGVVQADQVVHHLSELTSADFELYETQAQDPAILIYTSGTTGNPKGALIPHQAMVGNLTGFVCSQNWFGFGPGAVPDDPLHPWPTTTQPLGPGMAMSEAERTSAAVFWSPADWAWTGGLLDALMPSLYFGRPIVAWRGRFSPELAFSLMQRHGVTHSFLFPTALKAMMKAYPQPRKTFRLRLQAIMSAGEAVGDTVFLYCQQQLGVIVNEMFGQTEINYIVGNCAMNGHTDQGVGWPARPGSMGRPYPGHRVDVIDERGEVCADGEVGEVALHRRDVHGHANPIFFLGYWRNPQATTDKFTGDWCRTGDLATRDAQGYLWYQGRSDDVFKAAGYRIGPSEIENCLLKHDAVANAAVVPKPDALRGNLVKAFVVLSPGFTPSDELVQALQNHVRGQLAPYEYPKEIEFIDALPMTTTGKVQRRVLRLQEEQRAQRQTPA
ncbi:MAG: AMP-binding protein [Betaproteobacteria bacterium]|nr:AMP-binding protein [Betaproteobacteria bacterium]